MLLIITLLIIDSNVNNFDFYFEFDESCENIRLKISFNINIINFIINVIIINIIIID